MLQFKLQIGFAFVASVLSVCAYLYSFKPYTGRSPPWYPTRECCMHERILLNIFLAAGGSYKSWEESYRKAADMVNKMSLIEKVNITTGTGWAMGQCVGNTGKSRFLEYLYTY